MCKAIGIEIKRRCLEITPSQSFSHTLFFEVEDTGNGIAPEEIDAIFNPFVQSLTVIKSNEGTGLGLAISKKFVNLMGGNIIIKSTLNQGSTFSFDIKVNLAKNYVNQSVQIQQVIGLESNQPTYRILIVDDKFESRLVLVKLMIFLKT